MTIMGLNYLNYQESVRTNKAKEALTFGSLNESVRHNVVSETENQRTNVANEGIRQGSLAEQNRSNLVNEANRWSTLDESVRSNQAREAENRYSNDMSMLGIVAAKGMASERLYRDNPDLVMVRSNWEYNNTFESLFDKAVGFLAAGKSKK